MVPLLNSDTMAIRQHAALCCLRVPCIRGPSSALSTRRYPFVWVTGVINGYSSTRVSLWDSRVFGRLAMGFANVRAGTRVLMLVLVQASPFELDFGTGKVAAPKPKRRKKWKR